jgi:hypothetical protein
MVLWNIFSSLYFLFPTSPQPAHCAVAVLKLLMIFPVDRGSFSNIIVSLHHVVFGLLPRRNRRFDLPLRGATLATPIYSQGVAIGLK